MIFRFSPQVERAVRREADNLMSNGDVNAALYLHQVTGDVEPVVRAAMSSGSLTDQMVRKQYVHSLNTLILTSVRAQATHYYCPSSC